MKSCLILGCGRSGTSMTAGVLAETGYFMGEQLNPGNETNPKGQFEDREVNRINEELLAQVLPSRPSSFIGELFFRSRPIFGQRWLARLPLAVRIPSPSHLENSIRYLVNHQPFCFKDPRFSYTLPVWRRLTNEAVFVCVFRHPKVVVESIIKQSKRVSHLQNFSINTRQAFEVWELMYSHILTNHHPQGGDWLFLHYDQFFDGSAFVKLEDTLGVKGDRDFPDPALNRSKPYSTAPARCLYLYDKLCSLAIYEG